MNEDICLSGGADGADLLFGWCAGTIGHTVFHWGFDAHKSKAPPQEVYKLTQEQLNIADPLLTIVSQKILRHFPSKNEYVNNLLRRNYYQVKDSNSLYGIVNISNGIVEGGTAWAVYMFKELHNQENIYLYVQNDEKWVTFKNNALVDIDEPPTPSGIYTGVGSRKINQQAKTEIKRIYGIQKTN